MDQKKIPVFGKMDPKASYVDRPGAYGFLFDERARVAVVQTSFGLFLPGGGVETSENEREALEREVFEELGYRVTRMNYMLKAIQFHWSEFYQKHFKKIGSFYHIEATPVTAAVMQDGHGLLWLDSEEATRRLGQEFQRWALAEALRTLILL